MSELVLRLCSGSHPVKVSLRPERTALALKQRIEMYGFVHLMFTDTCGGTELIVKLDQEACDSASADFEQGKGKIRLTGRLKLDYIPVQCVADIDLSTLEGTGHLRMMEEGAADSTDAPPDGLPS